MEISLLSLADAIERVINGRSWAHAFEHLGLCGSQSSLSKGLLKQLQVDGVPNIEPLFPTLAELVACFPKRLVIPIGDVFGCVVKCRYSPHASPSVDEAITEDAETSVAVWHGRTRSTSSAAAVLSAPPPLPPPAELDASASSCPVAVNVPRLRRLPTSRMHLPSPP